MLITVNLPGNNKSSEDVNMYHVYKGFRVVFTRLEKIFTDVQKVLTWVFTFTKYSHGFYKLLTRNLLNIGFDLKGSHLDPAGHDEKRGEDLRPGGE